MIENAKDYLRSNERLDDLQINGFHLIQQPGAFCLGTDTVLLADFAAPRRGEKAADLGCGNGALGILLAARRSDIDIDSFELNPSAAELAQRNVLINELGPRVRVHACDLREAPDRVGAGQKSLVVCNPPYWVRERSVVNSDSDQNAARFEEATPEDFCAAASRLLRFGGRFCVVFPTQRAFEMMTAMRACKIEPKRIRAVYPDPSKAPKIALIEGTRGGNPGLNWMPPLLMKNADGTVSDEIKRIYG